MYTWCICEACLSYKLTSPGTKLCAACHVFYEQLQLADSLDPMKRSVSSSSQALVNITINVSKESHSKTDSKLIKVSPTAFKQVKSSCRTSSTEVFTNTSEATEYSTEAAKVGSPETEISKRSCDPKISSNVKSIKSDYQSKYISNSTSTKYFNTSNQNSVSAYGHGNISKYHSNAEGQNYSKITVSKYSSSLNSETANNINHTHDTIKTHQIAVPTSEINVYNNAAEGVGLVASSNHDDINASVVTSANTRSTTHSDAKTINTRMSAYNCDITRDLNTINDREMPSHSYDTTNAHKTKVIDTTRMSAYSHEMGNSTIETKTMTTFNDNVTKISKMNPEYLHQESERSNRVSASRIPQFVNKSRMSKYNDDVTNTIDENSSKIGPVSASEYDFTKASPIKSTILKESVEKDIVNTNGDFEPQPRIDSYKPLTNYPGHTVNWEQITSMNPDIVNIYNHPIDSTEPAPPLPPRGAKLRYGTRGQLKARSRSMPSLTQESIGEVCQDYPPLPFTPPPIFQTSTAEDSYYYRDGPCSYQEGQAQTMSTSSFDYQKSSYDARRDIEGNKHFWDLKRDGTYSGRNESTISTLSYGTCERSSPLLYEFESYTGNSAIRIPVSMNAVSSESLSFQNVGGFQGESIKKSINETPWVSSSIVASGGGQYSLTRRQGSKTIYHPKSSYVPIYSSPYITSRGPSPDIHPLAKNDPLLSARALPARVESISDTESLPRNYKEYLLNNKSKQKDKRAFEVDVILAGIKSDHVHSSAISVKQNYVRSKSSELKVNGSIKNKNSKIIEDLPLLGSSADIQRNVTSPDTNHFKKQTTKIQMGDSPEGGAKTVTKDSPESIQRKHIEVQTQTQHTNETDKIFREPHMEAQTYNSDKSSSLACRLSELEKNIEIADQRYSDIQSHSVLYDKHIGIKKNHSVSEESRNNIHCNTYNIHKTQRIEKASDIQKSDFIRIPKITVTEDEKSEDRCLEIVNQSKNADGSSEANKSSQTKEIKNRKIREKENQFENKNNQMTKSRADLLPKHISKFDKEIKHSGSNQNNYAEKTSEKLAARSSEIRKNVLNLCSDDFDAKTETEIISSLNKEIENGSIIIVST